MYLDGEHVENMCDRLRLKHHFRSIPLGFVRDFRTQFVDIDVL